jgi:phosphate transport system permease protein
VQLIDRIARSLISISGISIICAVLGIGLFLILEILPLFHGARIQEGLQQPIMKDGRALAVVVDEHQERVMVLGTDASARLFSLADSAGPQARALPGLEGHRVSAVARSLETPTVAIGTEQGDVWIGALGFRTVFDGHRRTPEPFIESEAMVEAVPGHRITRLAYRGADGTGLLASVADETHVVVTRLTSRRPLIGSVQRAQESIALPMEGLGRPTGLLVNGPGTQVLVGTSEGLLARWAAPSGEAAALLEAVPAVPGGAVSAMAFLLGERSVVVGGSDGSVATWSLIRDEASPDGWRLAEIHPFPAHASAVTAVAPSPRDKGFVTVSSDGTARLHYMTSERTLADFSAHAAPAAVEFAPKADGILVADASGTLRHWRLTNPHPEVSWRALFGKIWYEGYERPDHVWQSTGGTDDFESKFSLVPLIFGTLKGTLYALLFAIPLALFGALYCSQFLEKRWRSPIKSTVELMAALPSVVLGFVAGVVLAPLVQRHLVAVLAMPVLVPAVSIAWIVFWRFLPIPTAAPLVRRHEFWVLMAGVLAGTAVAVAAGPAIEGVLFGGNFEAWLLDRTGIRYDQRNALVVGWTMGFAVIPIIFTICEDAFSAVPRHLVGASLACGASAWQTAWRVILPAAGSGVFSAVMVGFGRAVGETMIVLMATGNTPVMDWTAFNGFRALSANIAVEIPEAPYGGTLYRVLFVAALLLFSLTFVVNTVAELIRLRLRRQLQGL